MYNNQTIGRSKESVLATNKVLRNTYMLLSMTLVFSGITAYASMQAGISLGLIPTLVIYFGLLFLTHKTANSGFGIVSVFLLTGFLGFTLGPMLNAYLTLPNGGELIMTALGGTGVIFLGLSGYALTSRKDFSFLGGMLVVGILVAFVAGLAAYAFDFEALSLGVSAMFILLMSGLILFQTSQIIHGGETNYIRATVTLYVAIYNLFASLLHILGAFSGND